ncbi:Ada metal-binding domain-containing protein [Paracoccus sp. (in: a-proteobacteria)]|uniref:Ada metal-binding domain-containing protein n=1 Tax=Paracoccus sp. TaxID=267 RepID=UPI003A8B022C
MYGRESDQLYHSPICRNRPRRDEIRVFDTPEAARQMGCRACGIATPIRRRGWSEPAAGCDDRPHRAATRPLPRVVRPSALTLGQRSDTKPGIYDRRCRRCQAQSRSLLVLPIPGFIALVGSSSR